MRTNMNTRPRVRVVLKQLGMLTQKRFHLEHSPNFNAPLNSTTLLFFIYKTKDNKDILAEIETN